MGSHGPPITLGALFATDAFNQEISCYESSPGITLETSSLPVKPNDELTRQLRACGIKALHLQPLRFQDDVLGLLCLINPEDPGLIRYAQLQLVAVTTLIASAISRIQGGSSSDLIPEKSSRERVYTRHRLSADLELFSQGPVGCIIADINGLKQINDISGLEAGDLAIDSCLALLRDFMPQDRIYRVGDDEFAVIMLNLTRRDFENKLFSIRKALSGTHGFSAAVGGSYSPSGDASATFSLAETSMFKDKSRFYLHSNNLSGSKREQDFLRALARPSAVRELIDAGAFYPVLQPIFADGGKRIIAAELLCRMRINGKEIPPCDFIPLLESVNLIYLIDLFNFEQPCRQLNRWKVLHIPCCPLGINLSRHTVLQSNFCTRLCQIADAHGTDRKMLHLEITESASEQDRADLIRTVRTLSDAGFIISVDDFGVDFANLITIADLPLNILKCDKRIVDTLPDSPKMRMIFQSFQQLCARLKVETIAEGVERPEQAELLKRLGCYNMQGFLFSRPLPLPQFEQLMLLKNQGIPCKHT